MPGEEIAGGVAGASLAFLLPRLQALAIRELNLGENISREIENLGRELRSIQAFLGEVDAETDHDHQFKQNIQDQAYDIEDVLDQFELANAAESVLRRRRIQYSINDLIKAIQSSLDNIQKIRERYRRQAFASTCPGNSSFVYVRVAPLYSGNHGVVGIEEPRNKLVSWALQPTQRLEVMFVVGMAGLGKTTLVRSVYDEVKEQFDSHAWITAASKSKTKSLVLFNMLEKFGCSAAQGANMVDLIDTLRNFLCKKRYVIILDDLRVKDVWECIKLALPNGDSSRIIVTTRRGDIANSCRYDNSISIHNLQPLPWEEAKRLFYTTAFYTNGKCPPDLEEVSKSILQKCDGLPLGIVELGKLLSTRDRSAHVWQKLLDSLESELRSSGGLSDMMKVLSASYNDLPFHLRYCFLYLSMFPQNNPVKRRRLIRLWIAEGFVAEEKGKTLEEVGEEYLDALIQRSLIKANEMDFDGRPASVRVDSLMHKMILSISHEENFSTVCTGAEENLSGKTRRLTIQKEDFGATKGLPCARTFISFCRGRVNMGSNFKLLKVLDMQDTPLGDFPSVITDLLLLKYLSLRNTEIRKIPDSLGKLLLLETLDLKQTLVAKLPKEVLKLDKLRHLLVSRYNVGSVEPFDAVQGLKVPKKIGLLKNLQKLSFVRESIWQYGLIEELGNLTQLRKLGIGEVVTKDGERLCRSIQKMRDLQSLTVASSNKEQPLELDAMTTPPRFLQRLHLIGPLERFPIWVSSLRGLLRIRLERSDLTRDNPIAPLANLPNLIELQLLDAYTGTRLKFRSGKFKKLKILHLGCLKKLKLISIKDGAFPCLQKLLIKNCNELEQVPSGMSKLIHLQELLLWDMPERFVTQLKKSGGVSYQLVRHIPCIRSYKEGHLEEDLS